MKTSIRPTTLALLLLLQWAPAKVYAWSTTNQCCRTAIAAVVPQQTTASSWKACTPFIRKHTTTTLSTTALAAAQGYVKNDMMDLLHQVNKARMSEGIPPVDYSEELEDVAYVHTLDMIKNHFFGHTGSDKSTLRERVAESGFEASVVGENLGKNLFSVQDAVAYWMSQTDGFEQILNPDFTHIGAFEKSGKWTQVFAAFGTAPVVNDLNNGDIINNNNNARQGQEQGQRQPNRNNKAVPNTAPSKQFAGTPRRANSPIVPNLNRGQPDNFNNGSRGSMKSPFSQQEPIKYPSSSQTRTMNNFSSGASGGANRGASRGGASYGGNPSSSGGYRSSSSNNSEQYSNNYSSSGKSSYNSNGSSSSRDDEQQRVRPNYDKFDRINNVDNNKNGNDNHNDHINNGDQYGITELDTHYEITMSVPGINEQDIKVQLEQDGRILCLRGERKSWDDARLTEVEFERRFALGRDVDKNGIGATVNNGILFVKIARDESRRNVATFVPVTNADEMQYGTNNGSSSGGSYGMNVDDYGPPPLPKQVNYNRNNNNSDNNNPFAGGAGGGDPDLEEFAAYGDERAFREYSPRNMGRGPPPGAQGSYGDERRYRDYDNGQDEFGAQTDLNGNPVSGEGASYGGVAAAPRTKKPEGYEASKSAGWSGWADKIPRSREGM